MQFAMQPAPFDAVPLPSPRVVKVCRNISWGLAGAVMAIGLLVLLGWVLDIDSLKSVVPGRVTQKPNTALGLMANGIALLLWHRAISRPSPQRRPWMTRAQYGLPLLVVGIGLVTLAEYAIGFDLGLNHLPFTVPPDAVDVAIGGRPAPNTAVNFVLTGSALLLLLRHRYRAAQGLSAVAFLIALLALTGHVYTVAPFYRVGTVTGMAVHTAIAFLLLSLGILLARADQGWMRDFSSNYDGSIMMRRVLPLVVVLPVLLGGVTLVLYASFDLRPEAAIALRSMLSVVVFSVIIWWNGRALNRLDAQRQAIQYRFGQELEAQVTVRTDELNQANQALKAENARRQAAEADLQESDARMRRAITFAPFPIVIHAEDGQILAISRTLTELTGYTADEIPTITAWTERAYGHRQDIAKAKIDSLYNINQRVHDGEFAVSTKAGETLIWDFSSAPLGYTAEGQRLVISIASDITQRKAVESELAASQTRLRQQLAEIETIYRSVPIGLNVLDRDLRFVRINERLAEMNGFSVEDHLGRTVRELLPDLADTADALLRPIFETGEPLLKVEIRGETPAQPGVERIWLESFLPLREGDSQSDSSRNRVIGISTVCEEITDRRRAEENLAERARQQAEVARIGQRALASDDIDAFLDQITVRVAEVLNVEYCKVLERLPDEQGLLLRAGVGWHEGLVGQAVVGTGRDSQAGYTLLAHEPVVVEDLRTDPRFNGPPLLNEHGVVSGISSIIGDVDRDPFGVIGVHTRSHRHFTENDVNFLQAIANILAETVARHQNEQNIRRINASLERRVEERTRQLTEANQELEAFAYSVSHDLRAPLRAVEGLARIFQEDYGPLLDETGREYTQIMIDSASQMDRLIQDLLAYSQLGRREIKPLAVNLAAVVDEALQDLAPVFAEFADRPPQIVVDPLPSVLAQRSILKQVFTNLLTNAVKFVKPDLTPTIRVWAETHSPWVRCWIEDNGIGISLRHQERIFRPFERLHGVETYPGTGIGLAIVQRGVERMGGQVGVESTLGEGSRFWIELPGRDSGKDIK